MVAWTTKKFQIDRKIIIRVLLIINKNSKVFFFFFFWYSKNHETFVKSDQDRRKKYRIEKVFENNICSCKIFRCHKYKLKMAIC